MNMYDNKNTMNVKFYRLPTVCVIEEIEFKCKQEKYDRRS